MFEGFNFLVAELDNLAVGESQEFAAKVFEQRIFQGVFLSLFSFVADLRGELGE